MTWIQTWDGKAFDLLDPSAADVDPVTIAVCLSRMVRFNGHTKKPYTIAQHSCIVCDLVQPEGLKLAALLHDAHECYSGFGDVCRPAKGIDVELMHK